jgi:hypothetical protein
VRSLAASAASAGRHLVEGIAAGIRAAAGAVADAVNMILDKLGLAQGGIAGFAGGGFVTARVGELGPEDVLLPVGARVRHASDTASSGGSNGGPLIGPIGHLLNTIRGAPGHLRGQVVVQGTTDPRVIAWELAWAIHSR